MGIFHDTKKLVALIDTLRQRMKKEKILDYPFTIRHLSKEEGSGYLIEFPDSPKSIHLHS